MPWTYPADPMNPATPSNTPMFGDAGQRDPWGRCTHTTGKRLEAGMGWFWNDGQAPDWAAKRNTVRRRSGRTQAAMMLGVVAVGALFAIWGDYRYAGLCLVLLAVGAWQKWGR